MHADQRNDCDDRTDLTNVDARASDDRVIHLRRHGKQALAVVDRLPLVNEAQVGKVVDEDAVIERHRNAIPSQLHRSYLHTTSWPLRRKQSKSFQRTDHILGTQARPERSMTFKLSRVSIDPDGAAPCLNTSVPNP